MNNRKFTEKEADEIWTILVQNVRAHEHMRDDFVCHAVHEQWTEYRFGGMLGFGGKVWNNMGRVYINAYDEDCTPEIDVIINKTNKLLEKYNMLDKTLRFNSKRIIS